MNAALFSSIAGFVRAVWQFRPGLSLFAAGLMLARSLSEGVGLFLIVPLLALIGVGEATGSRNVITGLPGFFDGSFSGLTLPLVLVLFLAVMTVRAMIGYVQQLVSARLQAGFLQHIRVRTHDAVLAAEWPYLAQQDASRINHTLSLHAEQSAYGILLMARMLSSSMMAAVSVVVAMLIEPMLTLIVIGLAVLVAVPVLAFDIRLLRMAGRNSRALEDMFASFGRELDDLKAAKMASVAGARSGVFTMLAERYRQMSLERARVTAFVGLFHELAGAALLAGLVYLATLHAGMLQVAPVAVALIFIRLFPAMRTLQGSLRDLLQVLPAWQRLDGLAADMQARQDSAAAAGGRAAVPNLYRQVELRNVRFTYPDSSVAVLDDVNLILKQGTATVIAGLSGAGKTTLLDIATGLLRPSAGAVLVDGEELTDANRAGWCGQVAYVVQDAQLSNGSVRDNVCRFASEDVPDTAIWQALEQAGAADFVRALPAQLDEQLGDRGQRLSRGQRQRVALARAVVLRPRLLLLDEATSALNPRDEELVTRNLQALLPDCTLLIVAHKLENLGWCDNCLELRDGRLSRCTA